MDWGAAPAPPAVGAKARHRTSGVRCQAALAEKGTAQENKVGVVAGVGATEATEALANMEGVEVELKGVELKAVDC